MMDHILKALTNLNDVHISTKGSQLSFNKHFSLLYVPHQSLKKKEMMMFCS